MSPEQLEALTGSRTGLAVADDFYNRVMKPAPAVPAQLPQPGPAPAPGAPGPKKATVRIGMPPKSDSKQTIKISRPGSGGGAALPQATQDERNADNERAVSKPLPQATQDERNADNPSS